MVIPDVVGETFGPQVHPVGELRCPVELLADPADRESHVGGRQRSVGEVPANDLKQLDGWVWINEVVRVR